ncbi:LicD family protein [Enterococcus faecium]|nr:LicD family protein [Enterococcus faecium]
MNELQVKILEIYKGVKKVCEENDIRYFAIGGTCIGAIRHHGFIPWDDDLDIAMPRKDYEKFKKIAITCLEKDLQVLDEKFAFHNENVFIKVHDINTALLHKELIQFQDRYSGVYIDIMPLDGLPNNKIMRKVHLKTLITLMRFNRVQKELNDSNLNNKRIIYSFIKLFPKNIFLNIYLKLVKLYSFDSDRNKLSSFAWSFRGDKLLLNKEDFSRSIDFEFEDTIMPCPIGYDRYLKNHFGDYMIIPEKENQVQHNNAIIDFSKSYKEYIKENNQ